MSATLSFDFYGTLIDTLGVLSNLADTSTLAEPEVVENLVEGRMNR